MTVNITISVPPDLAQRLRPLQERLPELLERVLYEVALDENPSVQHEEQIMETLTSNPTPEEILNLRPSPELQARVSELLRRNKQGGLSQEEETELDRYLYLEHLVRMAKINAAERLRNNH